MPIPLHLMRRYTLIYQLATKKKPTRSFLREVSDSSFTSFTRSMASLAEDYDMRVEFIADGTGTTGQSGYYRIADWGIINRAKFLSFYPKINQPEDTQKLK